MNKQIEEMTKHICIGAREGCDGCGNIGDCSLRRTSERLYNAGYRKIRTNDWLTRGISKEQLEREKQEALDEFAKRNGYCKAGDVAEQFKEIAKQYLLGKGLYLAVFKNALNHAEAELKKKYESEGE